MSDLKGDPAAFVFLNEIGIIEHLSRTAAERALPAGLSMAGFSVLNHMVRMIKDEAAPARIASAMQVTRGAMTGTLKRLEAEGWVAITPDPTDGRGKAVRLTPAGRAMREAALVALAPHFTAFLDPAIQADIAAILPALQRIRAVLDAARD